MVLCAVLATLAPLLRQSWAWLSDEGENKCS